MYEKVKGEIDQYCQKNNIDQSKFLAIVPEQYFERSLQILDIAKQRIGLSKNITYRPVPQTEQNEYMKENNTHDPSKLLDTKQKATRESLGRNENLS